MAFVMLIVVGIVVIIVLHIFHIPKKSIIPTVSLSGTCCVIPFLFLLVTSWAELLSHHACELLLIDRNWVRTSASSCAGILPNVAVWLSKLACCRCR